METGDDAGGAATAWAGDVLRMVFAAELLSDFSVRELGLLEECDRERRDVKERRVLEGSTVGIEGEDEGEEEEEEEHEEGDMYDVYEGT